MMLQLYDFSLFTPITTGLRQYNSGDLCADILWNHV